MMGSLGGLAGADAICANAAASARLPGTFIALLSTSTLNARDRLAGSRGWVNTAGDPVADDPSELFEGGKMFGLVDRDASGMRLPPTLLLTWSATDFSGAYDGGGACGDWTTTTGSAEAGFYDRSAPGELATNNVLCATDAHLYCFETGHVAQVTPRVSQGRIAFVSREVGVLGLSGFDDLCRMEATNAGLPGTYLAAIATTTTTIASRFAATTPWRRVDGTAITETAANMFDGTVLLAVIHQRADGTYLTNRFTPVIRVGMSSPTEVGTAAGTCSDWTTTTGTGELMGTPVESNPAEIWGPSIGDCGSPVSVLCLQE